MANFFLICIFIVSCKVQHSSEKPKIIEIELQVSEIYDYNAVDVLFSHNKFQKSFPDKIFLDLHSQKNKKQQVKKTGFSHNKNEQITEQSRQKNKKSEIQPKLILKSVKNNNIKLQSSETSKSHSESLKLKKESFLSHLKSSFKELKPRKKQSDYSESNILLIQQIKQHVILFSLLYFMLLAICACCCSFCCKCQTTCLQPQTIQTQMLQSDEETSHFNKEAY